MRRQVADDEGRGDRSSSVNSGESAPGRREDRAPHGGHPRRASFGHEGALVDEHQLFEHTVV